MQGDRLAQARRVYFHQAVCLFPMARGFFRWPSISAETFSAVISTAACPTYEVGEGKAIFYLTQQPNPRI